MIKSKKELCNVLKLEKKNYNPTFFGQLLSFFGLSEKNIIWRYQKYLRKWEYHYNLHHAIRSLLFKAKCLKLGYKYGFSISVNCFDAGLKIMHLGQILVNSNAHVGKNAVVHIGLKIVATGGISDSANIGNNCKFGVNATIIGNVKIGDDITIGAGSVVTKSFTDNHITIAGVPARIISNSSEL